MDASMLTYSDTTPYHYINHPRAGARLRPTDLGHQHTLTCPYSGLICPSPTRFEGEQPSHSEQYRLKSKQQEKESGRQG